MRASTEEQTGGAGTSEVMGKFQRIGWAPLATPELHDLGTDLFLMVRDARLFDRGLLVGAQVKAGSTWFKRKKKDEHGSIVGWWFSESEAKHFDYWTTHQQPHLLVLHDLKRDISYWVHVTPERVIRTGRGCKILVPAAQTVDREHLDDLLEAAAQQRSSPGVEGTAFSASSKTVPPARRLRYALIAPRLIAPHRNLGYDSSIEPEEAIALICQGRLADLNLFAERHRTVPDPSGKRALRDWRWNLVRALWHWVTTDDPQALREVVKKAPDEPSRVSASVLLTCAWLRAEQHEDALSLLNALIEEDKSWPVDQAWLLVQRARIRAELGDLDGARDDALGAPRNLGGDANDVTASALAAAAAWQLFSTAGFAGGDVSEVITASDTAVSWWRSQTMSWALSDASTRVFRAWAEDQAHRFASQDSESLNLFSAELNSDVTAEHGAWRSISALAARHKLMRSSVEDLSRVEEGLDELRRSGDEESLKLAIHRFRQVGPIEAVAAAANRIGPRSWTRTTAKTNLEFWRLAGDLLDGVDATRAALQCVDLVRDPKPLGEKLRLTFWLNLSAADALGCLLFAANESAHEAAANLIVSIDGGINDVFKPTFARVIRRLRYDFLSKESIDALFVFANGYQDLVASEILGFLAENGLERAKDELVRRAAAGDLDALGAVGPITGLSESAADSLIAKFEAMVQKRIKEAEASTWGFGGSDPAYGLVIFNRWFPKVARWASLVEFLKHPRVAGEHKRSACRALVAIGEDLPVEVREELAESLPGLKETKNRELPVEQRSGGLREMLAIATGALQDSKADEAVARLALGSQEDRSAAAQLLSHGWTPRMRPLLASLASDDSEDVRSSACFAIGRLAAKNPDDSVLVSLATHLATGKGVALPTAVMNGILSSGVDLPPTLRPLVQDLTKHVSAIVRTGAERTLACSSP